MMNKFLDPEKILDQLDVSPGDIVADFGCGAGFFSLSFAEAVGKNGKIFSIDVLAQALENVESRAKMKGLSNIETKRVNLEKDNGSSLDDNSIDWVIIKDMLFQNKNKEMILKEAVRVLKPGGKAIIVEWENGDDSVGPEKNLRIPKNKLEEISKEQGMKIEKKIDAGDFHYAFVASKS